MSGPTSLRGAFAIGLTVAAAAAVWWLGTTRLALLQSGNTELAAASTLFALALSRVVLIASFGPRSGVVRGWRRGFVEGVAMIVAAWPVVAMAGSASSIPVLRLALVEGALVAGAILIPVLGTTLRRLLQREDRALVAASLTGVCLAVLAWTTRTTWWTYHG